MQICGIIALCRRKAKRNGQTSRFHISKENRRPSNHRQTLRRVLIAPAACRRTGFDSGWVVVYDDGDIYRNGAEDDEKNPFSSDRAVRDRLWRSARGRRRGDRKNQRGLPQGADLDGACEIDAGRQGHRRVRLHSRRLGGRNRSAHRQGRDRHRADSVQPVQRALEQDQWRGRDRRGQHAGGPVRG